MAVRKRRKIDGSDLKFALKPVANPAIRSTFGDVGAFFQVRANREFSNELLEIPYERAAAKSVDESTLHLFWWDTEHKSLRLVEPSGVDTERRVVWGRIGEVGIYGAIGVHRDERVQRTLGILAEFPAADLRKRPALIPPICGLILCDGPAPSGTAPSSPRRVRDLCGVCLGLEVPELHIPELQTIQLKTRLIRFVVPPVTAPPVWPLQRHDYRNSSQSTFKGPASIPIAQWGWTSGTHQSIPVLGHDGTVYIRTWGQPAASLHAIDGATGVTKWTLALPGPSPRFWPGPWDPAIGPDGTIYIVAGDALCAVSPLGTLRWQLRGVTAIVSQKPGPDGSVFVHDGADVVAVTPSGSVKWRAPSSGLAAPPFSGYYGQFAVRDDGSLISLRVEGVAALDGTDGHVLWRYAPGLSFYDQHPPVVRSDGRVLVVNGNLEGHELAPNGNFIRSLGPTAAVAAAATGETYVSTYWTLVALDNHGKTQWTRGFPGDMLGPPAIASDGTLYVLVRTDILNQLAALYAINPATGRDIWSTPLPPVCGRFTSTQSWPVAIGMAKDIVVSNQGTFSSLR